MADDHAGTTDPYPLESNTMRPRDPSATVLVPSAAIATRWAGALRARLSREPLDAFVHAHCQCHSSLAAQDIVAEQLVFACCLFIEPVLPHRGDAWAAVFDAQYLDAIGHATSQISRTLSGLIGQPRRWRVAALIATARMLLPTLGPDMAARASAAGIGNFAKRKVTCECLEHELELAIDQAVNSRSHADLDAAREIVRSALAQVAVTATAKCVRAAFVMTVADEPANT